jgi:1-acyl-sn-glycerol-3-phosphate acyltransferase
MLYAVGRAFTWFLYNLIFRVTVINARNVPDTGGVILSANHRSNHDPIILAITQKRPISFMAKEELFKIPAAGWFFRHLGLFPVKRGGGDIGAVKKAIDIMKTGKVLSLFPEGTRNKTGNLLKEFLDGTAFVASKSGAVIIPVGISGKYKLFGKIKINYGQPINIAEYGGKPDIKKITSELKAQITALLKEAENYDDADN